MHLYTCNDKVWSKCARTAGSGSRVSALSNTVPVKSECYDKETRMGVFILVQKKKHALVVIDETKDGREI